MRADIAKGPAREETTDRREGKPSLREWWSASPNLSRTEKALAMAIPVVATALAFLPVLAGLGTSFPLDLGDPLPQAWQVSWGGHALLNQPLAFWQSNQFWPLPDTLAFSDALVGYSPLGMIGSGVDAAILRYDLLFLFATALAMAATWLLAFELGCPRWAAAVAGAAFAFSPWRLEQGGHLHVISSGGIPLSLFLLARGLRRQRPGLILAGFAAATWQVSIGFTLGIQLLYLLALLAVIGMVAWWRSGRPAVPAAVKAALGGGLLMLAAGCAILARPYLRVQDDYETATRTLASVKRFSPGPDAFLTAPGSSLVWSSATSGLRDWGSFGMAEKILFPGLLVLVLSLAGLLWKGVPRALRVALLAAALAAGALSLGVHSGAIGSHLPYRWLWEYAPGWKGGRTPGRLQTMTTLALALLAGFGATAVAGWIAANSRRAIAAAAAPLLCVLVVVEGSSGDYPTPPAPKAPAGLAGLQEPLLQLPSTPWDNRRYVLWSTEGFPEMLNGRSSIDPPFLSRAVRAAKGFPDRRSITALRSLGVRTVVIHTAEPALAAAERRRSYAPELLAAATRGSRIARSALRDARPRWAEASTAPLPPGSGVTRTLRRPLVIYRLDD